MGQFEDGKENDWDQPPSALWSMNRELYSFCSSVSSSTGPGTLKQHFGDVSPNFTVDARAVDTDEDAKIVRCPSRSIGFAVSADVWPSLSIEA